VKRILRRYDLPPAPVRCIARVDNVVYRVGRDLALRIYDPFNYTTPQIRSTLIWLEALARDTDIGAPAPRRNDAGELLTHTDDGRRCALLSWVEGRMHKRSARGVHFERMGRLMAQLHAHAARWTPPPGFERPRWDGEGLMGTEGFVGGDGNPWPRVPEKARAPLQRVAAFARAGLERAGGSPMLIHADLHLANLVFADGRARPIDFDDTGIGHPHYDWAAALSGYRLRPEYPSILARVERGYGARAGDLDPFFAARFTGLALWVAAVGQRPAAQLRNWRALFDRYVECALGMLP